MNLFFGINFNVHPTFDMFIRAGALFPPLVLNRYSEMRPPKEDELAYGKSVGDNQGGSLLLGSSSTARMLTVSFAELAGRFVP